MTMIERIKRWLRDGPWSPVTRWLLGPLLAGCSATPRAPAPPPPAMPAPPPAVAAASVPVAKPPAGLPAPRAVRTPAELRRQAAERLVAANPAGSYLTPSPPILLAIPVLEVELNRDGSVRRIQVLRHPSQAPETVQMAINAIHKAAPYGDLRHMPQPWAFTETFLFDDDKRFKPRTLD